MATFFRWCLAAHTTLMLCLSCACADDKVQQLEISGELRRASMFAHEYPSIILRVVSKANKPVEVARPGISRAIRVIDVGLKIGRTERINYPYPADWFRDIKEDDYETLKPGESREYVAEAPKIPCGGDWRIEVKVAVAKDPAFHKTIQLKFHARDITAENTLRRTIVRYPKVVPGPTDSELLIVKGEDNSPNALVLRSISRRDGFVMFSKWLSDVGEIEDGGGIIAGSRFDKDKLVSETLYFAVQDKNGMKLGRVDRYGENLQLIDAATHFK